MLSIDVVGEAQGRVAAAGDEVARLLDVVDRGGLGGCTPEQLAGLVTGLRAVQARAEAGVLAVTREVEAQNVFLVEGLLDAKSWLRAKARMTPNEAAATVRTARALGRVELAATAAALGAGEIDPAHARLIADGTDKAPAGAVDLIEPVALDAARVADPRAVADVMRRLQHALDPDAADARALARYDRRGLTLSPTLDGSMVIRGVADEVTGALLATAVDAASPLVAGDTRTPTQRRLDALAHLARHYLRDDQPGDGSDSDPDGDGDGGTEPIDTTSSHGGGAGSRGGAGGKGGARTQLIVTVDADTLSSQPGESGSPGGSLAWIGPITAATAQRLGCDSLVTVVALGPDGQVIGNRAQRRFFTTAQRRAIIARDGDRCPAPYCDRPITWSDGHHQTSWTHGGPTTVDNGVLPCEAHHLLIHEGHWQLHRLPDGRYLLQHPDGRTLGPEPHPPGHHRPPPHPRQ